MPGSSRLLACGVALANAVAVGGGAQSMDKRDEMPCFECHTSINEAFAGTRMAGAASSADFSAEWRRMDRPAYCLGCHAPSGGKGLICSDCHGAGPHPYPKVEVPAVCGRCHDAPGESTVRRFLAAPAARRGVGCLDCHLGDVSEGADHAFQGPTVKGFLDGVAEVRVFLREEGSAPRVAIVRITHKAGHALPGGTTGRSLWLLVQGVKADGEEAWRETVRFGWEHHPDGSWLDRTLPPGRPAILELDRPERAEAVRLRAELWYRFRPGPLDEPDPRAVLLSHLKLDLLHEQIEP